MEGKIIFITGGAGFIATNLIKRLIPTNKIIVYDNLSRNALKDSGLWDHPNLRVIQGDILDYGLLKESIPKNVVLILHLWRIVARKLIELYESLWKRASLSNEPRK